MDKHPESRKPRRLKGTYSYRVRNYVALGVLAFGAVGALAFHFSKAGRILQGNVFAGKFAPTEAEIDRKLLMGTFPARTSTQIAEALTHMENETIFKNSDLP